MEAHLLKYFGVKGPAPWSIWEPIEWIRGPSVCLLRKTKQKRKDWTITRSLWSGNWHVTWTHWVIRKPLLRATHLQLALLPTVNSHLGLRISYLQRANPLSPQNNAVPHPHVIKLHVGGENLWNQATLGSHPARWSGLVSDCQLPWFCPISQFWANQRKANMPQKKFLKMPCFLLTDSQLP